jgi:adenine-specific DNA-methyltransferase
LRSLLDERDRAGAYRYRAKVDLVYIDPPFMVNNDFRVDNAIPIDLDGKDGIEATKEPSLVEFIAYRDTWRNGLDSFLVMLRRRLELLKELLAPTGSIYVHLDWHAVHYVKVMLDELFGYENFVNEVVWRRSTSHNDLAQGAQHMGRLHDTLLIYRASEAGLMNPVHAPYEAEYVRSHYKSRDSDGRQYQLVRITAPGGASKGNAFYELLGYKAYYVYKEETGKRMAAEGRIVAPSPGSIPRLKMYLDERSGIPLQDLWTDIAPVNSMAIEDLRYPTQKPISLLERVIALSSPPGGLVLDCFMGSGTTCEAAERLGRRWIGIDAGKYGVHLARKRLILLHGQPKAPEKPQYDYVECDDCGNIERKEKKTRGTERYDVRPFTVENMGVYQRAEQWQDFQQKRSVYRDEMVKVFGGDPVDVHPLLHGKKGKAWVHVGPLDGPISLSQVQNIAQAAAETDLRRVIILSADFDTLSVGEKEGFKENLGVMVEIRVIPLNAIDEVRRRIEALHVGGNAVVESMAVPAFYAPLSILLSPVVEGRTVRLTLTRCEVDIESFMASQRPLLKAPLGATSAAARKRVADEQGKWREREQKLEAWLEKATSWQHFVDFWAIDWNYGERVGTDGKAIFETDWQSFRERETKKIQGSLTFTAESRYERPGEYRIAARVTDVFGNDGIATVGVKIV